MDSAQIRTPLGIAKLVGDVNGLSAVSVSDSEEDTTADTPERIPESLRDAADQLREYFEGKRKVFDIPLNPKGTDFQKRVWEALLEIPYAKTTSYRELSQALGDVKAIRAVAAANGKNPLWIIVPCHRVIGSDGSLTGYAGGLHRKKWLLDHENPVKQQSLF
ncbi:MAG: methylated-DNA--[protein]-cysteine S-methyltransferase [Pricia sp.]